MINLRIVFRNGAVQHVVFKDSFDDLCRCLASRSDAQLHFARFENALINLGEVQAIFKVEDAVAEKSKEGP